MLLKTWVVHFSVPARSDLASFQMHYVPYKFYIFMNLFYCFVQLITESTSVLWARWFSANALYCDAFITHIYKMALNEWEFSEWAYFCGTFFFWTMYNVQCTLPYVIYLDGKAQHRHSATYLCTSQKEENLTSFGWNYSE